MYGRKMIFITNNFDKIKNLHKGALIRPGRVDRIIEFKNSSKKDVLKLIQNFYPNEKISEKQKHYLKHLKWTPAFVSNICKISSSAKETITNLNRLY